MLEIVADVLAMGGDALRLLMLSDDLMFERFPRWKESEIARVDKAVQEVIFERVRAQRSLTDHPESEASFSFRPRTLPLVSGGRF